MIDKIVGIDPKVTFSSFDKHMTLRNDGEKNQCRFQDLKVMSTADFIKTCLARQESNSKHRHTSNEKKSYECEACKCGIEIMAGRRKKLPINVGLIK